MKVGSFFMSRKSKWSYETKLNAVQQYLNSGLSYAHIGKPLFINVSARVVIKLPSKSVAIIKITFLRLFFIAINYSHSNSG